MLIITGRCAYRLVEYSTDCFVEDDASGSHSLTKLDFMGFVREVSKNPYCTQLLYTIPAPSAESAHPRTVPEIVSKDVKK